MVSFVKIDIKFDEFEVQRTNYYDSRGSYPSYDYNLFTIDDMLLEATGGRNTVANVSQSGAIVLVSSIWNCDLDLGEDGVYHSSTLLQYN